MKDYYSTLGVGKDASDDDIKKAYRKLAHEHHPDKAGGNEAKFKEINEAYQVLGNSEKRAQYDRFGSTFQNGQAGGSNGIRWEDFATSNAGGFGNGGFSTADFDLGDIFGDLFGFGGTSRGRTKKRKGRDVELALELSFHDAAFGISKTVRVDLPVTCPHCTGTGAEPGAGTTKCSTCDGKGRVEQIQRTPLGQFRAEGVCPTCAGTGSVPKQTCTKCKGTTVIRDEKELEVKIPAGIDNGQSIRLSGKGEAGVHGGTSGDLYITVRVAKDPHFTRDGADVLSEVEIPMTLASLGGSKEVLTLDGEVSVKIPAGTQSGRILRLKNRGAHRLDSSTRGDQLIAVRVRTPEKLSKKAKQLLEELQKEVE